jgi:PPOX class probable F420-dependent enzyme
MNKAEREAFLAATHIAVVSVARPGRGPLALPVWYRYTPGGSVRFVTDADSLKARLIRAVGRISLCVQNETPPYQYVSVEGAASVSDDVDYENDIRRVALRYLGDEIGELYLAGQSGDAAGRRSVLVTLTPEKWTSEDYNKL